MSTRGLWLEGGTTFPDRRSRAIAACLAIAWLLLIAARNVEPLPAQRVECGADPWDFLRLGELVEIRSLAFLIEAHCPAATYAPGGRIELRHGGGRVDVEVRRLDIAGTTYFRIVSIGGIATP